MPIRNNTELFNVYSYRVEDTQIKILPQVRRGGADWEIRLFREGQQGPMWRGETLSQDVLERLGVGSIPQEKLAEINESVDWANQFLDYDTHFNRKERGQASISDLYDQTSKGQLVEKLTRDT